MKRIGLVQAALMAAAAWLGAGGSALAQNDAAALSAKVERLAAQVESLQQRVTAQEDVEKVRLLAFTYGYYMDNALYSQVKGLLSPNIVSCEVAGYGLFKGQTGCHKLWGSVVGTAYGGNRDKLDFGKLTKHYLLKDVIVVSPDGKTAKGRFDYLNFGGTLGKPQDTHHQVGIYNFDFVKEDGVWKIAKFWLHFDTINFNHTDWAYTPGVRCPKPNQPPDAPATLNHPFPETMVVPFFYPNPVTGQQVPATIGETRYWQGNWPGEWGGPCGKRADAPTMHTPGGAPAR